MNRQKKEACIESIRQNFAVSSASFVVGIQGLTVAQLRSLRNNLRKEQGTLQVVKNTLSRYALVRHAKLSGLERHLSHQVALVFAAQDPVTVARVLCDYTAVCERFTVVAGSMDAQVIDASMVRFLGTLPSRDVVVAQLCGALKSPISAHVGLLRQLMVRFVVVLQEVQKRSESAGSVSE